jgi:hypothetical protein
VALVLGGVVAGAFSAWLPYSSEGFYTPFAGGSVASIIADLFFYFSGLLVATVCITLILAGVWKPLAFAAAIAALGAPWVIARVGSMIALAEGNYPIKSGLYLSLVGAGLMLVGGIILVVKTSEWEDRRANPA